MIIQFFGLPGSGKTFYSKKISGKSALGLVSIESRIEILLFGILFFIFNPLTTIFFIKILIKENKHNRKILFHKLFKLFVVTIAHEQKSKMKKGDIIIDQGLILFLLSIYERKIDKKELDKFLPHLKNYFVYIIFAPKKTREERMSLRKRIPRIKFGLEYALKVQNIFEENENIVVEFIKKNFPYKLIKNYK